MSEMHPSDAAFEQRMCDLFHIDEPLTGYHLPWLLDAEAGRLRYDTTRYRNHGVANNAANLRYCGLLAHGENGMVLTDKGRARLARARVEQPEWFAEYDDDQVERDRDGASATAAATTTTTGPAPAPDPEETTQLGLFADTPPARTAPPSSTTRPEEAQ